MVTDDATPVTEGAATVAAAAAAAAPAAAEQEADVAVTQSTASSGGSTDSSGKKKKLSLKRKTAASDTDGPAQPAEKKPRFVEERAREWARIGFGGKRGPRSCRRADACSGARLHVAWLLAHPCVPQRRVSSASPDFPCLSPFLFFLQQDDPV